MLNAQDALRKILQDAPGSIRELADEAGLAHTTLLRAESGARSLTPKTIEAVVTALRKWSERCATLADILEAAEPKEVEPND